MNNNEQEKSLIVVNEKSIFYKIKSFFKKLFKKEYVESPIVKIEENKLNEDSPKEKFIEYIKNIEDEETKLLKLQTQYRSGEIKEEQLTKEQVSSLCDLYDKQIANLKKSNQIRKQKILDYKRKTQSA